MAKTRLSINTQRVLHSSTVVLCLGIAAAFLPGCAAPQMHVTRLTSGPVVATGKSIKIYELGDKVGRPYEILAVVSATGQRAGVLSKARKLLIAQAAVLGAEALVGYYYDDEKTVSTGDADGWAGALAVKFLPDGASASAPSKAVVALPHALIGPDLGTGRKADKIDAIARKHARLLLAKKGYYAILTEDRLAPGFPDALTNLDTGNRLNYGSPDADLVLAVSLGDRKAFNAILAVNASQTLGTALYSKSTNAVSWQNTGKGSSYDPSSLLAGGVIGQSIEGVGHIFVPSAKTVVSVHAALAKAFETLPDLSQPQSQK